MLVKDLKLILKDFPEDADIIVQVNYPKKKEIFVGEVIDIRKTKTKNKKYDRLVLISKCVKDLVALNKKIYSSNLKN